MNVVKEDLKYKNMEWFKLAEKSKWIDVGMYDHNGYYKLVQMRYRLDNNRKTFRTVSLGFINAYEYKDRLFSNILSNES